MSFQLNCALHIIPNSKAKHLFGVIVNTLWMKNVYFVTSFKTKFGIDFILSHKMIYSLHSSRHSYRLKLKWMPYRNETIKSNSISIWVTTNAIVDECTRFNTYLVPTNWFASDQFKFASVSKTLQYHISVTFGSSVFSALFTMKATTKLYVYNSSTSIPLHSIQKIMLQKPLKRNSY